MFNGFRTEDEAWWLWSFAHVARYRDLEWERWLSDNQQWLMMMSLEVSNFGPEARIRFHTAEGPKLIGWIARREESLALARNKRTAMAMAFHARLGADSVLCWCPVDILQHYLANRIY